MTRRSFVYGPAYLDRVLVADGPLHDPGGPPLDGSCDGELRGGAGLTLADPTGSRVAIEPPPGWPGPFGTIGLSRPLDAGAGGRARHVRGASWHDDLGGMGAGFASAFGGVLVSALGGEDDPTSRAVADRLAACGIGHRAIRVAHPADWTLLVSSGPAGDKLPIGFRGCHDAIATLGPLAAEACDLRVVASLPNRLAAEALRSPGAAVRFFAPAMRNVLDRSTPVREFSDAVDVLSLNRREWESLPVADADAVAAAIPLVAITDGPRGSLVRFRTRRGRGEVRVPAFPRSRPPRDTNRAGEAYAATLVSALLDAGWAAGPTEEATVREAARRASAAAALVLDLTRFGFPGPGAIDRALRDGVVGTGAADAPGSGG